jgi:hypothetical protein
MIGSSTRNLGGQTMSRKTVSLCDRCKTNYADFSMHLREATTNLGLKLTEKSPEAAKPGPFDLCKECMGRVIQEINTPNTCCSTGKCEEKKA